MQNNNNFRRPYFSVHNIPQTSKQTRRARIIIKKYNIKLKNINVPKLERSLSAPHNMKFFGRVFMPPKMFRSQQQQHSIKESSSPTRLSKIRIGRNTLKFSEHISNELSPTVIVNNQKDEDQVKEVWKRKSCHCSECGKQSLFQRDTMNYGVQINQLIKEQESAINKFKRSIRKQQTLLFPQYLNSPKNNTNNDNKIEEIQILRDDIMIKSFAHRSTLSSLVFEEQVNTVNKLSPINSQRRTKHSYFESFLMKQQKIMNQDIQQFSKQKGLLESLHKKGNFSNKNTQMNTPILLTPRSPASSIITGFTSQSPVKKNQSNVYLQPQKSKFFINQNRITTLPEVNQ